METVPATPPSASLPPTTTSANAEELALATLEPVRVELDSPDSLAYGFDSVWVKRDDGGVDRLDPATAKITASVPAPGDADICAGLGVAGESVWACQTAGTVVRIDPATNRVAATVPGSYSSDQFDLVEAEGRLWLLDPAGSTLVGVDVATGEPTSPTIDLGTRCTDVAADGTMLWAACPIDGQLIRVDVAAGQVTGRVALPDARAVAVSGDAFVGFADGVAQISGADLSVVAVYDPEIGMAGTVWAGPEGVWVRTEEPFLTRIDPATKEVVTVVDAPDLPSGGSVLVAGDAVWASAYDDASVVRIDEAALGGP